MRLTHVITLILLLAVGVFGQTNRGGLSGTVTDQNGAAIPGATVTVTNVGTNQKVILKTSGDGAYSAPSLDPVTYSVEVEAQGFNGSLIERVKVDTATTATVNVTLQPAGVGEQVTVVADTPLINTESGTPSSTITERQIVEMPLNNRSVLDLVLTVPGATGVAGSEDPELDSGDIPAPGFNVNVNGGRAGSTSILADGASNTGVGLGRAVVTFSPDTVQEFTVQRSNFSAEFGNTGGGIVNMTTKSGTNQYQGLLYWYHRNPKFNAAPFTTQTNNRPLSRRRQHQFGLTFSGPVKLPRLGEGGPRLWNGKDKSFFFVAFEPRYYYDETPFTALLPTDAMRRGDFSGVVRVNGGYAPLSVVNQFGLQNQIADATIYNHFTLVNGNQLRLRTNPNGTLVTDFTPFAFPGNVIPAQYLDPTSQELLQFIPKAGDYFLADGNLRNYSSSNFIKNLEKRLTVRLDHQLTGANRLTGRFTQVPIRGDRGRGDFQVGRDEINSGGTDYSWSKQVLLTDTHTFGSTVVNELRLNYTYGRFSKTFPPGFDPEGGRNLSTEFGLPSLTAGGLPEFQTGTLGIGFSLSQQNENSENSYEIADNVSWVRGDQTWKMGVSLLQQNLKTVPLFGVSGGRYEFARNRTLTNSNGASSGSGGVEFAHFLLGTYNQTTLRETVIPYYYQWQSGALYFQDDWKVRPNLTLNLGVRYSLQFPRTEKYDRQGAFLPELAKEYTLPTPVTLPDGRVITTATVVPFGFSGRGGRSRYIFPVEKMNFEPRFGFAWTPHLFGWNENNKLVLRGGYGMSHAPLTGMGRNPSPDFAAGTTTYGLTDQRNQFVDVSGRTNPTAAPTINLLAARLCCNVPVLRPQSPEAFLNIPEDGLVYLDSIRYLGTATATSEGAHIPYVQNWSFSAAYQLPQNTVLELTYTGAKGTHLFLPPINLNPIPFELSESFVGQGLNPLNPNVNDPLGRRTASGSVFTFSPAYLGARYLGMEGLFEAFNSSANSIYHAGSVSLNRRFARGLTYTVNYTYGKSIDEASDAGDVRFVNLNVRSPGHVNFGAPRSTDRSVSTFDIKHAFSATFLYDLPLGRGRAFLSGAPWIVNKIIGDWSLSGVGRVQSGLPLVTVLRDDNGLGIEGNARAVRPDVVAGVPLLNPRYDRSCPVGAGCEPYFNPAAFMRPVKGTLGNAPRTFDQARAPWQQFLDLSLQKNFPIGKDGYRRLQLRVDAINVLNHPFFRNGRLEDAGEIFAAPNEGLISNSEYDAWRNFDPANRPARNTPAGAAMLGQINGIVTGNRIPGTAALRPDFFHVPVPEGFFSTNANQFDISTLNGLQLYRLRQSYTPDRWGFLAVTPGRSGYSPRFIQFALKFYF